MNYLTFQLDWWLTKFSAVTFISTHDTRFLCVEIFTCMGISYYPAFQTMDHTMTMAFFFWLFIMLTTMLKWKWLSFYGLFDAPPSFTPKPCSHRKNIGDQKDVNHERRKPPLSTVSLDVGWYYRVTCSPFLAIVFQDLEQRMKGLRDVIHTSDSIFEYTID